MDIRDKEQIKKQVRDTSKKITDYTQESIDKAHEKMINAKQQVKKARTKAKIYVMENPEKSVLVAAGIGVAIGLLLSAILKNRD